MPGGLHVLREPRRPWAWGQTGSPSRSPGECHLAPPKALRHVGLFTLPRLPFASCRLRNYKEIRVGFNPCPIRRGGCWLMERTRGSRFLPPRPPTTASGQQSQRGDTESDGPGSGQESCSAWTPQRARRGGTEHQAHGNRKWVSAGCWPCCAFII